MDLNNTNKRKHIPQKKNIFDFYSTKKQKSKITQETKVVEYLSLLSEEEEEEEKNIIALNNNDYTDEDDIIIIKEEKIIKKKESFKQEINVKKDIEAKEKPIIKENTFEFKTDILNRELDLKTTVYRPSTVTLEETYNTDPNVKKIPSYRVHSFSSEDNKESDKITVDYFPKIAVTKYHFISHLHSDHHVGFSKKWLSDNPETIIVLGYKNYLPFLYKFNLINYKSQLKPLENEYMNITDRILVVPEDKPLKIYFNSTDNAYLEVKTIDANHCIGAVLFWIDYYDHLGVFKERILHTGDFRYNSKKMLPILKNYKFDKIYLDTTYISPVWNFTPKNELLELVSTFLQSKLLPTVMNDWFHKNNLIQKTLDSFFTVSIDNKTVKTIIVLGSYTIGKEFLAAGLSEKFNNCPVILDKQGFRATFDLPNSNFIKSTDSQNDIIESFKKYDVIIFLGSIRDTKNIKTELKLYTVEKHFGKLLTISISLSGWNFYKWKGFFQDLDDNSLLPPFNKDSCLTLLEEFNNNEYVKRRYQLDEIFNSDLIFKQDFALDLGNLPKWIIRDDKDNKVIFWKLSYSDHSSYKELSDCCIDLDYDEIIPTVNNYKSDLLNYHIMLWKLCNEKRREKE